MGGIKARVMSLCMGLAAVVIGATLVHVPAASAEGGGGGGGGGSQIRVKDECDPATFNAALGPNACAANGENEPGDARVTFDQFNAELARTGSVHDWRFDSRGNDQVRAGTRLTLASRGGETHTFTKVARFGGGFVASLNAASNNPTAAPECATTNADGTLTPVPANATNVRVTAGAQVPAPVMNQTANYQCCIHPWMRLTITVR